MVVVVHRTAPFLCTFDAIQSSSDTNLFSFSSL
jgi:hypothetical protein